MNLFGSSPSPPPAPDPALTANSQSQANINTAIANAQLNRVNQSTPWGSINYTQGPTGANGVPTWSSQVQLSPQQQALFDQQQGMQLQRGNLAGQFLGNVSTAPLDFGSLPAINNRGAMYSPVHAQAPQHQQGQPGQSSGPGGQSMDQIIAAAVAAAMAHQNSQQPQGGAPGQPTGQPMGGPALGQPGATPGQPPSGSSPLTYQDYLKAMSGRGGDSGGGTGAFDEATWNRMTPQEQWNNVGGGLTITPDDPRYAGLAASTHPDPGRNIGVAPGTMPSSGFVDPSRNFQGNGFWAGAGNNRTPQSEAHDNSGGLSDKQWAILAAMVASGGLAGGALGATAGGGDALAAGVGGGFGTGALGAGGTGAAFGAGATGAVGAGTAGSLVGNESLGLNMGSAGGGVSAPAGGFQGPPASGGFDFSQMGGSPTSANGALPGEVGGGMGPLGDGTMGPQSLWRQAGDLAQTRMGRAGISLILPQILRAMQSGGKQGGSK